MKTLVYGSCNLDYIYKVPRIVAPGETVGVAAMRKSPGGKGLNQAVALKKAGLEVYFAGKCGPDGALLHETLVNCGMDVSFLRVCEAPSGQAHIQVTPNGGNAILLYRGANHLVTRAEIDETLAFFGAGDLLVLQNEISELSYLIDSGFSRGMRVALNPSPFDEAMLKIDYNKVWLVFINETELAGLSCGRGAEAFIAEARAAFPDTRWVITLGDQGSMYFDRETLLTQAAFPVNAVDTTCAGDTFEGFFTEALCRGLPPAEALRRASAAAAVTVSRMGAAGMIPCREEVEALLSRG